MSVLTLNPRISSYLRSLVPPGPEGLVWWLMALASLGATSVIPLFSLYVQQQGVDLKFVGLMMAAFFITNFLSLYAAGRISDRIGRRPMMAAGLLGFALCSLGFLLTHDPWVFVVLRAVEGVAAACFTPAALAYVADRYPVGERGKRISQLAMAENLGLLLGPAFGGALAAVLGLPSIFMALALMCGIGGVMVYYLPPDAAHADPIAYHARGVGHWREVRLPLFIGVSARALAGGFAFGLYVTVWPNYLTSMGATLWQVDMTWTLFAIPTIFLATTSGRTIERFGAGPSATLGALFSALVVGAYAVTGSVPVLLLLCMVEGIGFAFAYPAQNTLTVQAGSEAMRGRVIGGVTAAKTLGSIVGALLSVELYRHSPLAAFGTTSLVLVAGAILLGIGLWIDHRRPPHGTPLPVSPLLHHETAEELSAP